MQNQGRGQGRECQAWVFISCAVLCAMSVSCFFVLCDTMYHAVCHDICCTVCWVPCVIFSSLCSMPHCVLCCVLYAVSYVVLYTVLYVLCHVVLCAMLCALLRVYCTFCAMSSAMLTAERLRVSKKFGFPILIHRLAPSKHSSRRTFSLEMDTVILNNLLGMHT